MVLCLRAELKVGTGDQPVSWQGPSLAVSQEKMNLSSSADQDCLGVFGRSSQRCPTPGVSQPSSAPTAETVSDDPSEFLLAG